MFYRLKKFVKFLYKNKRIVLKTILITLFSGFVLVIAIFVYFSKDLPSPEAVGELFIPESTKILDRTETSILYDVYGEQKRTVIAYDSMPDYIKNATIIAEDENFYRHPGFDIRGIVRAFFINLKGGSVKQGGSTITQQFVKNAFLTSERTVPRKIKEAILSVELELKYTKDEILALYLNQVPYGYNAYGIEAAAQTYFNKNAKDLTLAESATLAVLPQAPTYYSNNLDKLLNRKEGILNKMEKFGYISTEDRNKALMEEIEIQPRYASLRAPHFIVEVKKYLENKYGASFVQQAGLRVTTTLDTTLQRAAEDAVKDFAPTNLSSFNANNASLVAIDPKTGQILAVVGSKDYFAESSPKGCISGKNCYFDPQVNIATSLQQPGSSFKPFAYAVAFQKGYTPNTIVYDVPTEFNPECSWEANQEYAENGSKCYHPQNYNGLYFGPTTLKEALAQSRNVPSVKVLYLAGVEDTLDFAEKLGITTLQNRSLYGLSLVLGGGDVTLIEETSAFGVFATRGEKNLPVFILKVEDKNGNILEEFKQNPKRVLEENTADLVNYVLSKNDFRKRVFGEQNYLEISGLSVATKTGTTQEYRDGWTVGYTQSLIAGVWVGNNNNNPMRGAADGSAVAAPIWNRFMRLAYGSKLKDDKTLRDKGFYFSLPPIGEEQVFRDPEIKNTEKNILDGILTDPHSILHYVSIKNPLGSIPENPSQDPQYKNWENAVISRYK